MVRTKTFALQGALITEDLLDTGAVKLLFQFRQPIFLVEKARSHPIRPVLSGCAYCAGSRAFLEVSSRNFSKCNVTEHVSVQSQIDKLPTSFFA